MINPRSIHIFLAGILPTFAAIAAIISLIEPIPIWITQVVQYEISIYLILFISIIIIVTLIPFYILNRLLFLERAKHKNTQILLKSTEKKFRESEKNRMTDVVSGIPNEHQFLVDLCEISSTWSPIHPYQMIFIDLDGFGKINKKHGYNKGDEVIEYFATSINSGMRRNEEIYKLPYKEELSNDELWRRAYRKYTGGDEFIFVIQGSEADALGFLVRLQRLITKELSEHIKTNILNDDYWHLSFSGGICPIEPNDTKETVFERAQDCMRLATQPGSQRRIYWSSKATPTDFPEGSWQYRNYKDAIDIFKK
jgi:GGDEF domain-containing protein